MGSWLTVAVGLATITFSAILLILHWREWRELRQHHFDDDPTGQREQRYRYRRLRRRLQTSGMVGVVGVGFLAAVILRLVGAAPLWVVSVWSAILLLVFWIFILALADIVETQRHFGRLRQEVAVEQAKMLAQFRRHSAESAGQPPAGESSSGNGRFSQHS